MSTDGKAEVSEHNQIPIDKDKLKEAPKAELRAVVEAFEQQCLLSYSTNRSGEVIKSMILLLFHPTMSHSRRIG